MDRRGGRWVAVAVILLGLAGVALGALVIYALAAYGGKAEAA
jgi:hypothetical protein